MGIEPTYPAWKAGVLRPPGPKPGALAKLSHTPSQLYSTIHSKLHTKSKNQTFLKAGHLDSASLHLDDFATQNSVCIK